MLPFKLVYSDAYYLPIGEHVFPAEKYRRIRDRLLADGVAEANDFLEPEPATDQDILLVHKPEYVHKLKTGTLSPREEMETGDSLLAGSGGGVLAGRRGIDPGGAAGFGRSASASALAADFIMPSPTTAKASA